MSEQTRQQVTIAVDLKKYRIRIHRSTLTLLGTPKYVQFVVSPSAMMLAIQGTDKRTNYTHRVILAALHPDNSYEIYSTSFVNKLCSLVEGLDSAYAYSQTGDNGVETAENRRRIQTFNPSAAAQRVFATRAEYYK